MSSDASLRLPSAWPSASSGSAPGGWKGKRPAVSETDALSVVCERMPHSSDTTSATEKYVLSLSPVDETEVSYTVGCGLLPGARTQEQ